MTTENKPQAADGLPSVHAEAFDEDAAIDNAPSLPYDGYSLDFVNGARWQYNQSQKQIEELKAELFKLKQKEYYPGFAQAQIETYKERLKDEVENTVHLESIVKTLKEQIDQLTKELASVSEQRDTYRDHVHKFRK